MTTGIGKFDGNHALFDGSAFEVKVMGQGCDNQTNGYDDVKESGTDEIYTYIYT